MDTPYQSEDGCDQWIAENLKLPEKGFFVDVGCAHPVKYSQTHWLRWLGWRGLAIDGDPAYAPEWCNIHETTFVNVVLSNIPAVSFLIEPTNSLVSRVHPEGKVVPARTLDSVLREYGVDRMDFMSLDIEGMEAAVLLQFFNQTSVMTPKILVVEYNSCHKGRDPEVFNVMLDTSYKLKHLTDCNAVFAR